MEGTRRAVTWAMTHLTENRVLERNCGRRTTPVMFGRWSDATVARHAHSVGCGVALGKSPCGSSGELHASSQSKVRVLSTFPSSRPPRTACPSWRQSHGCRSVSSRPHGHAGRVVVSCNTAMTCLYANARVARMHAVYLLARRFVSRAPM